MLKGSTTQTDKDSTHKGTSYGQMLAWLLKRAWLPPTTFFVINFNGTRAITQVALNDTLVQYISEVYKSFTLLLAKTIRDFLEELDITRLSQDQNMATQSQRFVCLGNRAAGDTPACVSGATGH